MPFIFANLEVYQKSADLTEKIINLADGCQPQAQLGDGQFDGWQPQAQLGDGQFGFG